MNLLQQYLLLGALAGITLLSFQFWTGSRHPLTPTSQVSATQKKLRPQSPASQASGEAQNTAAKEIPYDLISDKTLFLPSRTENSQDSAAANSPVSTEEELRVNREFELVGIARIGKPDSATPIALIQKADAISRRNSSRLQELQQNSQRGNAAWRGRSGNQANWNGRQSGQPQQPIQLQTGMLTASNGRWQLGTSPVARRPGQPLQKLSLTIPTAKIYRIGDLIEETNYTVKAILPETNTVILAQNGRELRLVLDIKNTKQSVRREQVLLAELDKNGKLTQQKNREEIREQAQAIRAARQVYQQANRQVNRQRQQNRNRNQNQSRTQQKNAAPSMQNTPAVTDEIRNQIYKEHQLSLPQNTRKK